jgi:Domain of unknown function (DUF4476)
MKTIYLLPVLAFSVMLLTAVTNSGSRYYDECHCTCDACRNCKHGNTEGDTWNNEYYRAMSSRDFTEFKKFISERTFESTKLDMTKSVVDNNMFTIDQVREILSWFTFESNKLDIAKYTFKNTVDRNSYYKLYNAFAFESSVVDLDNFVKDFR